MFTELIKPGAETEVLFLKGGATIGTAMFVSRAVIKDVMETVKIIRDVIAEFRKTL